MMNNLSIHSRAATFNGPVSALRDPEDLLNPTTQAEAVAYFTAKRLTAPQKKQLLDRIVKSTNEDGLNVLVKHKLIDAEDIKKNGLQNDVWVVEQSAKQLVEAIESRDENLINTWLSCGLLEIAFEQCPVCFTKDALEDLLKRNRLSPQNLSTLYKTNIAQILLEILTAAFFDANNRSVDVFRKSTVFKAFIEKAFQDKNARLIKKLAESKFITTDVLKQALSQSNDLHQNLKSELKALCTRSNQNKILITFFLVSGVTYDADDLLKVAQAGDSEVLKIFEEQGANIGVPISQLIHQGERHSIDQLFGAYGGQSLLDPNLKTPAGNTLLIEAVICDQAPIIRKLLESGANPLIRNSQNQSVFDLLQDKSIESRKVLYNPKNINANHIFSIQFKPSVHLEETAFTQLLKKKTKGNPIANFYGLFAKINSTVIAILKQSPFSNDLPNQPPVLNALTRNRIQCWSPSSPFPVPEEFGKEITLMQTLGFAIIQAEPSTPEEEVVKVETRLFRLISLPNDYKSKNTEDQGFKYGYEKLITHGHGQNIQAAYSALKSHTDGIRLNSWPEVPDIRAEQETLVESNKKLDGLFAEEFASEGKLVELAEDIDDFVQAASSIIHARYTTASDNATKEEENSLVEENHDAIREELKNISLYSFNERRLEEWQIAIRDQIKALQNLEAKLQKSKCINSQNLTIEKQSIAKHLEGIKDIIVENSVTSAEVPTLKIYSASLLIEDVFNPTGEGIQSVKKEICRLIGFSLQKIPLFQIAVAHFLENSFRERILEQFQNEAQLIVHGCDLPRGHSMQLLAADLAILNDTSKILKSIPPVARNFGEDNPLLEATMKQFLSHYRSARRILNGFWEEICCNDSVLDQKVDHILGLLSQRFLIVDEESRIMSDEANKSEQQTYLYNLMEDGHPKRMLDEQLYLLQTCLLFALQKRPPETSNSHPWIEHVIRGVQIRQTPSFHGIEKSKYHFDGLFLPLLLAPLRQVKGIAVAAYQANSTGSDIFKPLNDLLSGYDVPAKEAVENGLRKYLQDLSKDNPLPKLPDAVLNLIMIVQQAGPLIQNLKASEQNLVLANVRKKIQDNLDDLMAIIEELKFGEGQQISVLNNLLALLNKEGDLGVDREGLKSQIIFQLKATLKKNLNQLKLSIKSFKFDESTAEQAKNLQVQFKECKESIAQYLSCKESSSTTQVDFSSLREGLIQTINSIKDLFVSADMQTQLERCSLAIEKIQQPKILGGAGETENEGDLMILEIMGLCKFLATTKYLKNPTAFSSLTGELHRFIQPFLEECLHMQLRKLPASIGDCQSLLHDSHIKKLQQISVNLRLGIREQIYYTTENKNVSYFLWDGKPFDDLPYHSDNDVHIPLVYHRWSTVKKGRLRRNFLPSQEGGDRSEELHVTRIANKINDE